MTIANSGLKGLTKLPPPKPFSLVIRTTSQHVSSERRERVGIQGSKKHEPGYNKYDLQQEANVNVLVQDICDPYFFVLVRLRAAIFCTLCRGGFRKKSDRVPTSNH